MTHQSAALTRLSTLELRVMALEKRLDDRSQSSPWWKIRQLEPGEFLMVSTEDEQRLMLTAGRTNGIKITTRKINGEGWRVTRLK